MNNSGDVSYIPLPDEVPPPPSGMSSMPRDLNAFDSLMAQNKDLTERLSVQLRRNLEIEDFARKLNERNSYLELQAKTLHGEMNALSIANSDAERRCFELRDQRDQAERQFAELQSEVTERLMFLSSRVRQLSKFRERVHKIVRPYVRSLKQTMQTERDAFQKHLKELLDLRDRNQEYKKQLNEAYQSLQETKSTADTLQRDLVETYELKLSNLTSELDITKGQAESDARRVRDLESRMRQLVERQALIENRAVVAERNLEELRSKFDTETSDRQNEIIHLTTENKRLEVVSQSLDNAKQQLNQALTESQTDLNAISDRYSGLQILWEETLKRAQEAEEQIQSLKKINQELSQNLRERRIDYDKVKEQLALLETQSSQKLKALMDSLKSRDLQFSESFSAEFRRDLPPVPNFDESETP